MNILISSIKGSPVYKNNDKSLYKNSPVFLDWVTHIETYDNETREDSKEASYYRIRFIGDHYIVDWCYESALIRDDRYNEILQHFLTTLNAKTI